MTSHLATRLVVIESPYAGDVVKNKLYLRYCIRDCFNRNEAPFASHQMYTDALDDMIPGERSKGTNAGLNWGMKADAAVVYTDLGLSAGMEQGITAAADHGRRVEFRKLPKVLFLQFESAVELAIASGRLPVNDGF